MDCKDSQMNSVKEKAEVVLDLNNPDERDPERNFK